MNMKRGRLEVTTLLSIALAALTSGCATRGFVRTKVEKSATELTAKMEQKDHSLQQAIDANSGQIEELGNKASEQSRQVSALNTKVDTGLSAANQKAEQAQSAASQAATHVSQLGEQFQNRNRYTTQTEQTVLFKTASAKIQDEQLSTLDQIAQQLNDNADAILILEGRTDSVGEDTYNIRLSDERVQTVSRYLVGNKAVPLQRLYMMGLGEGQPLAANDTPEGRAQNRSVTLKVLVPNPKPEQISSNSNR